MGIEKLKQIWPEWEIEETPLGKGSYGVVYKAVRRDHNVESYAAIKAISIPSDLSEVDSLRSEGLTVDATRTYLQGIVEDFVSEIQLMESLKGIQNIVSVEDYKVVEKTDEIGWDIYIRMELLKPFNSYICDRNMTETEIVKLGCDICTALEICSKKNIIHRDIKPENIFINDFGNFKLGDFGIARKLENMTGGLSQKGTFNYMAPEVARCNTYDARVDIYSLGIVLYRLLNENRLPLLNTEKQLLSPAERKNAVERRLSGEPLPAPCNASPEMSDLILRACAYKPEDRFADASEMKKALISILNGNYKAKHSDNNETISVRRAPAEDTVSVKQAKHRNSENKVSNESETVKASSNHNNVPTFGKKKKSKAPKIIAAVLSFLIVLGGGGAAAWYFIENNADTITDNEDSSIRESISSEGSSSSAVQMENSNAEDDDVKIQAIIDDAEQFKDINIDRSISKIEAGLITYPNSSVLMDKLAVYQEMRIDMKVHKAINDATALAAEGDFLQAMKTIGNAQKDYPNNSDLQNEYESYSKAYVDSVIQKADETAEEGNYTDAITLIEDAQVNVKNNEFLDAAKEKYEQNLPDAYLQDLQYTLYDHGGFENNKFYKINGSVTSYLGDKYTSGLLFSEVRSEPDRKLSYDLEGKYTKLKGRISMIETVDIVGLKELSQNQEMTYVTFMSDDTVLYRAPLNNVSADIDFEFDVSGISDLTIVLSSNSPIYSQSAYTSYFAITGLELYE